MGDAYPELKAGRDAIVQVVQSEEERFGVVLTEDCRGSRRCSNRRRAATGVAGEQAFKLYDTYGLPRDFIEDLASAQGLQFDADGLRHARCKVSAKRRARRARSTAAARAKSSRSRPTQHRAALRQTADTFEATRRRRWTRTGASSCSTTAGSRSIACPAARAATSVLATTPFYLEAGGQVSDRGA